MTILNPTKTQIRQAEARGRKSHQDFHLQTERGYFGQRLSVKMLARQKKRRFCSTCGSYGYVDKFPNDGMVCDNHKITTLI